ncbi:MAG: septation protein IspZ, partial [Rhodobacteraceae bacterium]|nr:septation protein IspZ [Paracoccaceae bacterium]
MKKIDPRIKLGLELGPILLFFIAFRFFKDRTFQIGGTPYSGLVAMTALLVVLIVLSSLILWRLTGKLSPMQL